MKKTAKGLFAFVLILVLISGTAMADDWFEPQPGYYTLLDENGEELTVMAREISTGDEYISTDNKHYIVTKVDKKKRQAFTRLEGQITLPPLSLGPEPAVEAAQVEDGSIIIYCTHNAESYVPTEGAESISFNQGNGGINDVAKTFAQKLEERGIRSVFGEENHEPHDAGAYRRSRQTAVRLIRENMPVQAVFDVHRDAGPKSHYETRMEGQRLAKVRIVLGRRNQNRQVNEEFAKKIKAVADKHFPGLLKDIFIGKGSYNQELSPRSLLLEIGTAENTREEAERSAGYMAEVISRAFYGGGKQDKDKEGGRDEREEGKARKDKEGRDGREDTDEDGWDFRDDEADEDDPVKPISREDDSENKAGGRGVIWLVVLVLIAAGGFLFISMGGRELASKFKGNKKE